MMNNTTNTIMAISKKLTKQAEKTLLERKNELLSKSTNDFTVDFDGDETDEIQAKLIASVSAALNIRDKNRLERIERALKKIKDNTFGKCEDCDEFIADKRLATNPEFLLCISCAEERDLNNKTSR